MTTGGAIYVHIPFCEQKCRYCDFVSFGGISDGLRKRYLQALCQENELVRAKLNWRPQTIFIGGGTPTALAAAELAQLLQTIERAWVTDDLREFTVEANPNTLTGEKLTILRTYHVDRLSIGMQSADDGELAMLGRTHTFAQVQQSIALARAAGFANINIDLIYGLPGQTLADWQKTVQQALALQTEHMSLYQLKIEPGTIFDKWLQTGRIAEFDDEVAFMMYETAKQMLRAQGYHQYEISNYAKPGYESLHNQAYWFTDDYYGLGLAAHSFLRPSRYFNPSVLKDYLTPLEQGRLPEQMTETLTEQQAMEETIFMGLRRNDGVDLHDFRTRYDKDAKNIFAEAISKCQKNGWLEIKDDHLRLTEQGRVLGNLVFVEFV